jgi:hypothetical protein
MMRNPYIGPRAFRTGEKLPAREREEHELTNLLIAERVVLLHAPSGAGKTSLIQAGLIPLLGSERLGERRFLPTPPLRIKTPVPAGRTVHNRYVYSVALDLLRDSNPAELEALTLPQVVARAAAENGAGIPVLVFDQFEEILTVNPADRDGQREFFDELGAVLADGQVWALFAMREEYMGGLDRYVHQFPDHLRTTYRLDYLDTEAARVALQLPAKECGVEFTDAAADDLLGRLSRIRIQRPDNGVEEIEAPYVVPFQLQVVCRRLWTSVLQQKRTQFTRIEVADVARHSNIGQALRGYYADAVAEVARSTGADVRVIREWCEMQLITLQLYRSQTLAGPVSGAVDPHQVLLGLTDAYLLRSDTRAGVTWYELSHDRLIQPILDDNREWRRINLAPWQLVAGDWRANQRSDLLLSGDELRTAQRHASTVTPTEWEQKFLDESLRAEQQHLVARAAIPANVLGSLVLVELIVITLLILLLWIRT